MLKPAARKGDWITATDTHIVLVRSASGETPVARTFPFEGPLADGLSRNVFIEGQPAATSGSAAVNTPEHRTPEGRFRRAPGNRGVVVGGSGKVRINGKPAARSGDRAKTCNDPVDQPVGEVVIRRKPSVFFC